MRTKLSLNQETAALNVGTTMVRRRFFAAALILSVFIVTEIVLYAVFLTYDATGKNSVWIKYPAVLLCVAVSWLYFSKPTAEGLAVGAALIFTAISDYFLLVTGEHYEAALVTFLTAQIFYLLRIYLLRGAMKRIWISVLIRLVIVGIVFGVIAGVHMFTAVNALAGLYFVNLAANTVEAAVYALFVDGRAWIFVIGLILFCACDICVGLANLDVSEEVMKFVSMAMWVFYMPSQVLLVLSKFATELLPKRLKRGRVK